jgi:uncharacterized membrane protein YhaH (DUF805 family)
MNSRMRVRWGVRAVLMLGVAASVTANVLHARDNPISQAIAAWPPLALLITVEVVSRVPITRRRWSIVRIAATAIIASIAAWVSYWHMAGVALRYGETEHGSARLLPLSVDGLIVVASICLVELGGRIRAAENINEGGSNGTAGEGSEAGPAHGEVPGEGPERPGGDGEGHRGDPAGGQVEVVPSPAQFEPPKPVARKPHTANPERIRRAYAKEPDADPKAVARRLKLSPATVKRYRPVAPEKVNGKVPDLEGAR